jgi:hypothetical protein
VNGKRHLEDPILGTHRSKRADILQCKRNSHFMFLSTSQIVLGEFGSQSVALAIITKPEDRSLQKRLLHRISKGCIETKASVQSIAVT